MKFFGRETIFSTSAKRLEIMIREDDGIVAGDFVFDTHEIIIQQKREVV